MSNSLTMRFRQVVVNVPVDAGALFSYTVLTSLLLVLPTGEISPFVGVVAAPLVLFVPGYALLSGLFPRAGGIESEDSVGPQTAAKTVGITLVERIALSFGLSVVIVPIIGILLVESGMLLNRAAVVGALDIIIVTGLFWGAVRRTQYPTEDCFQVPVGSWFLMARDSLFRRDSKGFALMNVGLVAVICLWAGSFGYLMLAPPSGNSYSELTLLTESDDGEYVAAAYPDSFEAESPQPMVFSVTNHEGESTEYTVVVQLQRVRTGDGTVQVVQRNEVDRYTRTLADNETWHKNHTITATQSGQRLRLAYLLYRDDTPVRPTISNAYRHGYIWVNVTAPRESR